MPPSLSPQARQYRTTMWMMVVLAIVALVPAIGGARGVVPSSVGAASGVLSVAALLFAGALGLKGFRLAATAREKESERIALVILAGTLKTKSSEELEPLAAQGGAAGQAARMILARRRDEQKQVPPGPPSAR